MIRAYIRRLVREELARERASQTLYLSSTVSSYQEDVAESRKQLGDQFDQSRPGPHAQASGQADPASSLGEVRHG